MEHPKKFYLIFGLAVLLFASIFAWQIRKTMNIDVTQNIEPLISEQIYNISIANDETPLGNPGAAITITEYLDLNCSDCTSKYNEINKVVNDNPTKLRLFLKLADTSGLFSHDSTYANTAAYCANQQKRYWQFLDSLMSKEKRWSEETLNAAAGEAKMNLNAWNRCRENENTVAAVNLSLQLAKDLGVNISPTIFVNNKRIDPNAEISLTEIINKFIE